MEVILAALVAFILGRTFPPSRYADLSKPDRILKWDADSFGWRPVASKLEIQSGTTVLLAFETTADPDV